MIKKDCWSQTTIRLLFVIIVTVHLSSTVSKLKANWFRLSIYRNRKWHHIRDICETSIWILKAHCRLLLVVISNFDLMCSRLKVIQQFAVFGVLMVMAHFASLGARDQWSIHWAFYEVGKLFVSQSIQLNLLHINISLIIQYVSKGMNYAQLNYYVGLYLILYYHRSCVR